MKQIDRTTPILLALLVIGVWALLIRSFAAPSAADTAKLAAPATSDEISVKRLNIVGEDGKPRLILANAEHLPGAIIAGEELPRAIRPAGILFYNENGTECGGLGISKAKDGTEQRTVTFDYTQQETDGIAMLRRERADKSYTTGFMPFDRLPLDSDVRWVGSGGTLRVSILDDSQDAKIILADPSGKERIRLSVDRAGIAKFEILDASGKPVYSAPYWCTARA
jgi:hypothetical protein